MDFNVEPIEIIIDSTSSEVLLEGKGLINFEIKNLGTPALTLFNITTLQTEDCWQPPTNSLGVVFSGRIPVSFSSTTNARAVLYGLRLINK